MSEVRDNGDREAIVVSVSLQRQTLPRVVGKFSSVVLLSLLLGASFGYIGTLEQRANSPARESERSSTAELLTPQAATLILTIFFAIVLGLYELLAWILEAIARRILR